jgi:hypothetical protein
MASSAARRAGCRDRAGIELSRQATSINSSQASPGSPALREHASNASPQPCSRRSVIDRLTSIGRPPLGRPTTRDDPVDVIVVGARRRFFAFDDVVIHRPRDLERLRPQRRANIVCTNNLRTVLDLGAVDPSAVSDAVGHLITNRLVTLQPRRPW